MSPEETPAKITAQTARPADQARITARIDLESPPANMAVGDGFLWAIAGNSIVKIDPQTNQVVGKSIPAPLPANAGLEAIAVGEDALWITTVRGGDISWFSDIDAVSRIDPQTGETVATIKVRRGPMSLALTPGVVWVVNFGRGNTVSRIDSKTNQITGEPIRTGAAPYSLTAGDGSVWVANHDEGTVTRIDPITNQVIANIPVPHEPHRVAFGEGMVWVGNWHDKSVSRIDPQTNQVVGEPIPIGYQAGNIAAGYGNVWVTSDYRGVQAFPQPISQNVVLVRIDPQTNQVVDTIPLGGHPVDVEITEEAVWVSIQDPNMVLRIDPSQPIGAAQPVPLPTPATSRSLPPAAAPVLKGSASMRIGRVIPLGDDFPFGLGFARHSLRVVVGVYEQL